MKSAIIFVVAGLLVAAASAQFFETFPSEAIQPPPLRRPSFRQQDLTFGEPKAPRVLTHPAVERNANDEAKLPAEVLKSPRFYGNPRTAEALAKDSWFAPGEMQVFNREAEKIPREQVFKIFKHAGFIRRR